MDLLFAAFTQHAQLLVPGDVPPSPGTSQSSVVGAAPARPPAASTAGAATGGAA